MTMTMNYKQWTDYNTSLTIQPVAVQAKHRSGYDLDRVREVGGWGIQNKSRFINNEKEFDRLSIIKPGETLEQWKARVMEEVKILISRKSHSIYHRFCLHASSGDVESDASYSDYKRPETHSSRAVICFKCWEIFRPNDETCGRTAKDLMQEHWENECGRIRINYCDPLVLKNFFNSMHNDARTGSPFHQSLTARVQLSLFATSAWLPRIQLLCPYEKISPTGGSIWQDKKEGFHLIQLLCPYEKTSPTGGIQYIHYLTREEGR
ncbi:hypothetical protein GLOIN_2v1695669 [Rhizophagus irregularis DAOM 181602=DAOM 197198]|nr:hypothetical protein GLOIN_2v1695669 [Rhizophagus irregularis DAOM 181602=DAOM 197198]